MQLTTLNKETQQTAEAVSSEETSLMTTNRSWFSITGSIRVTKLSLQSTSRIHVIIPPVFYDPGCLTMG